MKLFSHTVTQRHTLVRDYDAKNPGQERLIRQGARKVRNISGFKRTSPIHDAICQYGKISDIDCFYLPGHPDAFAFQSCLASLALKQSSFPG